MRLHVGVKCFLLCKRLSTDATGSEFFLFVSAADMAVVGSVGCKRFTTELALEGLLPRVLPDMCAENTGGSEFLGRREPRK